MGISRFCSDTRSRKVKKPGRRKTVEGFMEVLEDLLPGFRLQVFTKRAQRKLVEHSKFYYMDAGVFRSLCPKGPLDFPEEIGGACLEGLVAQHLRAWIAYSKGKKRCIFGAPRLGSRLILSFTVKILSLLSKSSDRGRFLTRTSDHCGLSGKTIHKRKPACCTGEKNE